MNSYRKALCASALVLTLVSLTRAGEIQHPVVTPPPPGINSTTQPSATEVEIQTGEDVSTPEADTIMNVALDLVRSLLTLF